jgi:hypothetical protein
LFGTYGTSTSCAPFSGKLDPKASVLPQLATAIVAPVMWVLVVSRAMGRAREVGTDVERVSLQMSPPGVLRLSVVTRVHIDGPHVIVIAGAFAAVAEVMQANEHLGAGGGGAFAVVGSGGNSVTVDEGATAESAAE